MSDELPARVLEASKSSRAKCKACKEKISKGMIRFGTRMEVMDSVWPGDMQLASQRQANNLHKLCEEAGTDLEDYLTYGEGVSDEIKQAFTDFFNAIRAGEDTSAAAAILSDEALIVQTPAKKQKVKKTGFDALKMSELKALLKENGLKVSGKKAELISRLKEGGVEEPE